MVENYSVDSLMTFPPPSSSLSYFLQISFSYVRATAALSLSYPSVTPMTNLPKLSASQRLPHMPARYTLQQSFQSSCEQKSAASSPSLMELCDLCAQLSCSRSEVSRECSGIQVDEGKGCHCCIQAGRFKLWVRDFLLSPEGAEGWTGTRSVSDAELIKPPAD